MNNSKGNAYAFYAKACSVEYVLLNNTAGRFRHLFICLNGV